MHDKKYFSKESTNRKTIVAGKYMDDSGAKGIINYIHSKRIEMKLYCFEIAGKINALIKQSRLLN